MTAWQYCCKLSMLRLTAWNQMHGKVLVIACLHNCIVIDHDQYRFFRIFSLNAAVFIVMRFLAGHIIANLIWTTVCLRALRALLSHTPLSVGLGQMVPCRRQASTPTVSKSFKSYLETSAGAKINDNLHLRPRNRRQGWMWIRSVVTPLIRRVIDGIAARLVGHQPSRISQTWSA